MYKVRNTKSGAEMVVNRDQKRQLGANWEVVGREAPATKPTPAPAEKPAVKTEKEPTKE